MKLHEIAKVKQTAADKRAEFLKNNPKVENFLKFFKIGNFTLEPNGKINFRKAQLILNYFNYSSMTFSIQKFTGILNAYDVTDSILPQLPREVTDHILLSGSMTDLSEGPDKAKIFSLLKCTDLVSLNAQNKEKHLNIVSLDECNKLKSLRGLAQWNCEYFKITDCPALESFEGLPDHLNTLEIGNWGSSEKWAEQTKHLKFKFKSLKGMPKTIKEHLYLSDLPNITSLEGCSEFVGGICLLSNLSSLESLEGLPYTINKLLTIRKCDKLRNLGPIFDVHGLKSIKIQGHAEVSDIINKWLPSRDIAKAGKELEKINSEYTVEY